MKNLQSNEEKDGKVISVEEKEKRAKEAKISSYWQMKFNQAMIHKAPYTKRWITYRDAYNGDYFKNGNKPDYKSDLVSNYIFSTVETIKPIMVDNDPKFQAIARQPDGAKHSNDLQEALLYEWDREEMSDKVICELNNVLTYGTAIFFAPWDTKSNNVKCIPVNPFNIYPDPLATNIDDAEYIIYACYKNVELLKRSYPNKKDRLKGADINYGELVQDNNKDANVTNQVLVLEVWCRDYTGDYEDIGEVKLFKQRYPRGRVITLCPELGIVLDDKENPYKDGKFPFVMIKDYSLPNKFWGEGEVAQLLSPQKYMNELTNAIIDNAKTTANPVWIVDNNSGVKKDSLSSRPGLVIRKNQGTEVRRDAPTSVPMYMQQTVDVMKMDIEQISGVFNTVKGNSETGVYTAQGILALQEAGQARIRLKVKNLESGLSSLARMWFSRMKQYWKENRFISITKFDGSYDLKAINKNVLEQDYDVKVLAGSTMPVSRSSMLDMMIRLAQTPMPDGQPLVDREAVVHYLPEEVKSAMLKRMEGEQTNQQQQMQQMMEQVQQMMQQLGQQIEQVGQESSTNDEETFGVIEEMTSAIEDINKKILQLQKEHDTIKQEEELNQIKQESYNMGYADAENYMGLLEPEQGMMEDMSASPIDEAGLMGVETPMDDVDETVIPTDENGLEETLPEGIPDDVLEGLMQLSDEELLKVLEEQPELLSLLGIE